MKAPSPYRDTLNKRIYEDSIIKKDGYFIRMKKNMGLWGIVLDDLNFCLDNDYVLGLFIPVRECPFLHVTRRGKIKDWIL
jgi:hypothetical protein